MSEYGKGLKQLIDRFDIDHNILVFSEDFIDHISTWSTGYDGEYCPGLTVMTIEALREEIYDLKEADDE